MIAKGTTHDNGGRLARYLVTGKEGERSELWELRGFAAVDIVDAFRSVHVIADGTKCQQPFFHVQVRNPETDRLSRDQWQYTANRIESMLGLKDQPRAIAFHIDEKTGEEHIHIAWSRIDDQTMTAKALPYFKDRLKKLSRELEMHFGITLVPNERESSIKYAPTRAEDEQARRLGLDAHTVRETIRDCYERSDCGRGFEAALAEEGMVLARGERRDFVVIDQAGGTHALGKRILGVTAAQTRERLSDLPREQLPSVDQAKEFVREQTTTRQQEKAALVWDRDRDDIAWQNAIVAAAIAKAKRDDRQHRTHSEEARRAQHETHWPIHPPESQPLNTSPAHGFEDGTQLGTQLDRDISTAALKNLGGNALDSLGDLAVDGIQILGDLFSPTPMTPDRIAAVIDAKERASEVNAARFEADAESLRNIQEQAVQKVRGEQEHEYLERDDHDRQR